MVCSVAFRCISWRGNHGDRTGDFPKCSSCSDLKMQDVIRVSASCEHAMCWSREQCMKLGLVTTLYPSAADHWTSSGDLCLSGAMISTYLTDLQREHSCSLSFCSEHCSQVGMILLVQCWEKQPPSSGGLMRFVTDLACVCEIRL